MKIGIISDIHSNAIALDVVLQELEESGVDRILCAGDLVGYYPFPNEVVSRIKSLNPDCVLGNHDVAVLEGTPSEFNRLAKRAADWNRRELTEGNKRYLDSLPTERRENIQGRDVYLAHGSPTDPINEYIWEEDVDELFVESSFKEAPDIVVLGHTHRPYIKVVEDTLVVNPGSVGQPRDRDPRASYAVIDTESREAVIHRAEYQIELVAEETKEYLPRRLAERLYEGR